MVSYIRNGEVNVRVTIPVTRLFDLTKHLLELELELLVLIRQHRYNVYRPEVSVVSCARSFTGNA